MNFSYSMILSVHALIALTLVGLVLLQHGKGADMGAAFGSGASGSLFGATGSANFLSRVTAVLATGFFLTSLGLSYIANSSSQNTSSIVDRAISSTSKTSAPVTAQPEKNSLDQAIIPSSGASATTAPAPAQQINMQSKPVDSLTQKQGSANSIPVSKSGEIPK